MKRSSKVQRTTQPLPTQFGGVKIYRYIDENVMNTSMKPIAMQCGGSYSPSKTSSGDITVPPADAKLARQVNMINYLSTMLGNKMLKMV